MPNLEKYEGPKINFAKGSPVMEATIVIRNKDTGDVINEIRLDVITNMEQDKNLTQYPVKAKPGRRVFVPGATRYTIEGISEMDAEELVEYIDNSLKPAIEDILNDKFEGAPKHLEGNIFEASSQKVFGRVNPAAFGMDKDKFEETVGAYPTEPAVEEDANDV